MDILEMQLDRVAILIERVKKEKDSKEKGNILARIVSESHFLYCTCIYALLASSVSTMEERKSIVDGLNRYAERLVMTQFEIDENVKGKEPFKSESRVLPNFSIE